MKVLVVWLLITISGRTTVSIDVFQTKRACMKVMRTLEKDVQSGKYSRISCDISEVNR